MLDRHQKEMLDRHITGNYGEDQFKGADDFIDELMDQINDRKFCLVTAVLKNSYNIYHTFEDWVIFEPHLKEAEMTSEDIYCRICGEPWNIYGIFHGDMRDKERDKFLKGLGCPCCSEHKINSVLQELTNELVNMVYGDKQ